MIPYFLFIIAALISRGSDETQRVGPLASGGYVVATGQVIRPAGISTAFHGRPIDLAIAPDGGTVYFKDNRGVVVIDAARWQVRQELAFPSGGGSLHGIAVSADGRRVYATNSESALCEAVAQPSGTLAWQRIIQMPGPGGKSPSYPCGVALAPDGRTAYVALSRSNSLAIVDLETGRPEGEIAVGVAPWGVALAPGGKTAYVTDWGGRRPRAGELTAPSAGTDTLVDRRGIASSGALSVVDLPARQETAQIAVGLHPCDLKVSPDGGTLYVANANSDTVSLIDTAARRVTQTLSVRPAPGLPFGSAPTGIALSAEGRTLYVGDAGNNAIAVISLLPDGQADDRTIGFVPAGWYPGAVAVDRGSLYIANVKGFGSRLRSEKARGWSVFDYQGTAQRVPLPIGTRLPAYTAQVRAEARGFETALARRRVQPTPVPAHPGEPSVFQHIVYIIKENRSYDQMFGDLKRGNGDSDLVLFGRDVTPNHHALAEQFVLLDNFYCNGVLSADGHSWATEGDVTDHLEKAFGGFTRSYTFGDDPLTYSSSGFLWDNALRHGLTVRNYGEMDYASPSPPGDWKAIYQDYRSGGKRFTFRHSIGIANLKAHSSPDYPGWNLSIPDAIRADCFLRDLRRDARLRKWPSLVIVYLPDDHTSGASPGAPTPRAQVADNDLALGRVVEGITHSRFWPQTCVFVVEDDPQDGLDHVDGHRSPALVISPYTRRGAVVSRFYNQTSILHTLQRMLGLPALNQMDAASPLMTACFTEKPNLAPYRCLPNRIPLDEMNPPLHALRGPARHWARVSLALRLDRPDLVDEQTFNRILWFATRGTPYPIVGRHAGVKRPHAIRPHERARRASSSLR